MIRYLITLFLAAGALQLFGQEVRFPFLVNGKYAISNIEGELLTEPIYDGVITSRELPFIAVRKDGLWGFVNYKGQIVMQPAVEANANKNVIGVQGPFTKRAGNMWTSDLSNRYPFDQANLFYSSVWPNNYFFNPFVPNDKVQPFLDRSKINHDSKSRFKEGSFDRTGLYKVATLDSKINFLDTTGIPIFKQPVYDGYPVSPYLLAVENESKKFALFDRSQNAITGFIYDEVQAEDEGNFIRAQQQGQSGWYALYSNKGKLIMDSLSGYPSFDHGMAIIKNIEENKVMLLDSTGKIMLSFPNASLEFNRKRNDQFFYGEQGQYGLIDRQGTVLVQPTYSSLGQLDDGNYYFSKANYSGVLDTNYVELWRLVGVDVTPGHSGRPDLYTIRKQGLSHVHSNGLVDHSGKIIFEPQYKFASYWKRCDLYSTQTDSTIAFYNSNLEMIIPPTKHYKTTDCEKGKITFGEKEYVEFDLTGKLWVNPKRDIQVKSVDGLKFLLGPDQKALTKAMYSTLKPYKADSTRQQIFLGLRNESDPFYEIINEQGTTVDLKDYGVPAKDFTHPSENGLIIVVNKAEYTSNKLGRVKRGVVDFNGAWVIEPDYQQVLMVQNELIYVSHPIKESITTYNRYGEKISSKAYIFESRSGNVQPPRRIEVTYGKNEKEYLEFLKQLWSIWRAASNNETYEPIAKDFPEMVYGYIDLNGKEVVETKYKEVSGFRYGYVCVVGEDKAGKPYSAILDLFGKELCKTDYDEISFFDNDSTTFRVERNELYGAIDIKGNTKLQPIFSSIEKDSDLSHLWTAQDAEASYLIGTDFNPVKIGPPGTVNLNKLPGDYYYLQISNIDQSGDTPSKTVFYDSQGKMVSHFDNAIPVNDHFGKYNLPDGFVLMNENNSKLPFVFNITSGKAYRK